MKSWRHPLPGTLSLILALTLATLIIPGLGIYGPSLAAVLVILALSSRRFCRWLCGQPGYRARVSRLRGWHDETRTRLAVSIALYLLPMSLLCTAVLLLTLRTPARFLAAALAGLGGLAWLYLDLLAGLGLDEAQLDPAPAGPPAVAQFWRMHHGAAVLILLSILLPLCAFVYAAMRVSGLAPR